MLKKTMDNYVWASLKRLEEKNFLFIYLMIEIKKFMKFLLFVLW